MRARGVRVVGGAVRERRSADFFVLRVFLDASDHWRDEPS